MDLTAISSSNAASGAAKTARTGLGEDLNTFLTMLTTQLKNQDPTNPMDTHQMTAQLVDFANVEQQEHLTIRFHDSSIESRSDVTYSRISPDRPWTFLKSLRPDSTLPTSVQIVPEDYVPLRHAKTRTRFREHLLRCVHDCHKVLGNLVLFKCVVCKNRLVTFHPDHQPSEQLTVTRTYLNAVEEWHNPTSSERTKTASFHKGKCQRCEDTLRKVEKDTALAGIATFSAENMMDLLWGLPDIDKPLTPDDSKLLAELHYCFDNATVVEEMLVALLHMQVDICYMRPGRRKQYTGLPCFRKNIIAFPQELSEVKQLLNFWTSLSPNDVVNVEPPIPPRSIALAHP